MNKINIKGLDNENYVAIRDIPCGFFTGYCGVYNGLWLKSPIGNTIIYIQDPCIIFTDPNRKVSNYLPVDVEINISLCQNPPKISP